MIEPSMGPLTDVERWILRNYATGIGDRELARSIEAIVGPSAPVWQAPAYYSFIRALRAGVSWRDLL